MKYFMKVYGIIVIEKPYDNAQTQCEEVNYHAWKASIKSLEGRIVKFTF